MEKQKDQEVKKEVSEELSKMGFNMPADQVPDVKADMITEQILEIIDSKEKQLNSQNVIVDCFMEPKALGSVIRFRKLYHNGEKWVRSKPEKIKEYIPNLIAAQAIAMVLKRVINEIAKAIDLKNTDIMLCFQRNLKKGGVDVLVKHADLSLYNTVIDNLDIDTIFG